MKVEKMCSFQPTLWPSSAEEEVFLREIESGGIRGEDVETFTEDTFEFQKAMIGGDEGAPRIPPPT